MKKNATLALVALVATMLIIPQSLAATSQGFFYRADDGDRFYFTLDATSEGDSIPTEVIYIEIENASIPIPDPVTHLSNFSYLDVGIYFENGTSLGLLVLIFLFLPQLEFPVGNWDLISTLAATDLQDILIPDARDISISSSDDYWGFSYAYNDSSDAEAIIEVEYSKFDGMMYRYDVEGWNTTTHELTSHWTIQRFSYHNLRWGFNDGDSFDYHLVMTGSGSGFPNLVEDFYLQIHEDGLFNIPYNTTEFDDIPYVGGDIYWANGTICFDPFLSHAWRIAVPIGNWSLLDDIVEGMDPTINATLDDPDPWFWGYSRESTSGDVLFQIHTDYLKVDGFLARHTAVFTNTTTSEVIGTISVEREGLLPYTDRTSPIINHPDDVEFVEGLTNQNITWVPTDDNPTTYEVTVNGTVVDSGSWTSGSSIVLELDDFEAGVYDCTITVYDIGSNNAMDSVTVTVTAPGGGLPDIIMDNLLYIGIGIAVVVVLGAVVVLRKRS